MLKFSHDLESFKVSGQIKNWEFLTIGSDDRASLLTSVVSAMWHSNSCEQKWGKLFSEQWRSFFIWEETFQPEMSAVWGNISQEHYMIKYWCMQFKCHHKVIEDAPRRGCPESGMTEDNVSEMKRIVFN